MLLYDEKYIKAKVREFIGVIKRNFLGHKIPKQNVHNACMACITIDSDMRIKKMSYPQVYLEECKCKIKKIKMTKFINTEIQSKSELVLESDTRLELKVRIRI